MSTKKLSRCDKQTALNEFERFCEAMDVDCDVNDFDEDDRAQFNKVKSRLVRAIENGHLVITENGEACYTPHRPQSKYADQLIFRERSGADLMNSDQSKKGQDVHKMYSVLAGMCGVPTKTFAGLVGADIKVCEALFMLLAD